MISLQMCWPEIIQLTNYSPFNNCEFSRIHYEAIFTTMQIQPLKPQSFRQEHIQSVLLLEKNLTKSDLVWLSTIRSFTNASTYPFPNPPSRLSLNPGVSVSLAWFAMQSPNNTRWRHWATKQTWTSISTTLYLQKTSKSMRVGGKDAIQSSN